MRSALLACAAVVLLAGCAPDIAALAGDPATGSLHVSATYPGAQILVDYTRVNSTGTAASASAANGTTVNVPPGATVNPAPVSTTTLTAPATTGVTIPQVTVKPLSYVSPPYENTPGVLPANWRPDMTALTTAH